MFPIIGILLHQYAGTAVCVKQAYTCDERSSTTFTLKIPVDIPGESYMYLGLSDFYSTYIGIRVSYSAAQLQGAPRNKNALPYEGCEPIHTLNDVKGEKDLFLPIDEFATDKNWRSWLSEDAAKNMTLRPCGGLYYWIPTDTFSLTSSSGAPIFMDTVTDLSWDTLSIPREPSGTSFPYVDDVTGELVWADPSTQRMRAWLRTNIHPNFIVKTGTIPGPLKAGTYTVTADNCRDLESDKYIQICNTGWMGYEHEFLTLLLLVLGSLYLMSLLAYFVIPTRGTSRPTLFHHM